MHVGWEIFVQMTDEDNSLQVDEFLSRGQMLVVVDGTGRMADILSYAYREGRPCQMREDGIFYSNRFYVWA